MGQCSVCKEKILYNKYKMYRGKILCPGCYNTRLERKAAKKAERQRKAQEVKIVTPAKRRKRKSKKLTGQKLDLTILDDVKQDDINEQVEDSN